MVDGETETRQNLQANNGEQLVCLTQIIYPQCRRPSKMLTANRGIGVIRGLFLFCASSQRISIVSL